MKKFGYFSQCIDMMARDDFTSAGDNSAEFMELGLETRIEWV